MINQTLIDIWWENQVFFSVYSRSRSNHIVYTYANKRNEIFDLQKNQFFQKYLEIKKNKIKRWAMSWNAWRKSDFFFYQGYCLKFGRLQHLKKMIWKMILKVICMILIMIFRFIFFWWSDLDLENHQSMWSCPSLNITK